MFLGGDVSALDLMAETVKAIGGQEDLSAGSILFWTSLPRERLNSRAIRLMGDRARLRGKPGRGGRRTRRHWGVDPMKWY